MKIKKHWKMFFTSFILLICTTSSLVVNAFEENKAFIKSVICAYNDNKGCDLDKKLSEFDHCPAKELNNQGAIGSGIYNWSFHPKGSKEVDTIKNVIITLLKKGCDINRSDINGKTPLHTAIILSQVDAIDFLIENRADLFKKVGLGKKSKRKNTLVGLNSFELIKKYHSKDSIVNNVVYGDTKIYTYMQKKYPEQLEPLIIKKIVIDLSNHIPTKFGKVLIRKTALDPRVLMYDVYANKDFPIKDEKTELLHFNWFKAQKIIQQACSNFKVINRTPKTVQKIDAIRYLVNCD